MFIGISFKTISNELIQTRFDLIAISPLKAQITYPVSPFPMPITKLPNSMSIVGEQTEHLVWQLLSLYLMFQLIFKIFMRFLFILRELFSSVSTFFMDVERFPESHSSACMRQIPVSFRGSAVEERVIISAGKLPWNIPVFQLVLWAFLCFRVNFPFPLKNVKGIAWLTTGHGIRPILQTLTGRVGRCC